MTWKRSCTRRIFFGKKKIGKACTWKEDKNTKFFYYIAKTKHTTKINSDLEINGVLTYHQDAL